MATAASPVLSPWLGRLQALFADLGYPVDLLPVDSGEWRRAGIDVPDGCAVSLLARRFDFDLYLLTGAATPANESLHQFLASLSRRNTVIKTAAVALRNGSPSASLFDLDSKSRLRRLDIPLADGADRLRGRLSALDLNGRDQVPIRTLLDRALDRESISRSFFVRFRKAVGAVADDLRAGCRGERPEDLASQALLILSRILFLYFVQRKGWLNGEARFLIDRFDKARRQDADYFATVLRPLFFGCLNTPPGERDRGARALGRIPYLNGGLFEPSPLERRHPDMRVSNSSMSEVLEGVFERYDFSVDETDGAGSHIDPEMLGKVFESLMAAEERCESGSYYTPREIVDTLVRRALVRWCTDGDEELSKQMGALLDGGSGELDRAHAARFLERLERVAVLDPACGSGAFLLSALLWIERMIERLCAVCGRDVGPALRQRIVERSLFGVDIKPEAVRLCELRLWLAIVSGQAAQPEEVAPLPNLDRNIFQGNSLLSPTDFAAEGRFTIYRSWLEGLRAQRALIDRYRTARRSERPAIGRAIRRNDLLLAGELIDRAIERDEAELGDLSRPVLDLFGRKRTRALPRELAERLPELRKIRARLERGELDFFSFEVHFAHVLAGGGFDIVVGNPPWVRNSRIGAPLRRRLAERYRTFRGGRGFSQCDLSVVFFEKALSLATAAGVASMLVPSKIANAGYASVLREQIGRLQIVAIDDWGHDAGGWFEADTFPLALTVSKASRPGGSVRVSVGGQHFRIPQAELARGGDEWPLIDPDCLRIIRRLEARLPPLSEALQRRPFMGVKTGDNARFFPRVIRVGRRTAETASGVRIPLEALCRCVRGRDLQRWQVRGSSWMLWPPRDGWRRPPGWLEELAKAEGVEARAFVLAYVRPEHAGMKVVWKDVARGLAAAVLPDRIDIDGFEFTLVPNQTLYGIEAVSRDEAYALAAILNSTLFGSLVVPFAERAKDDHFRYFGRTIGRVPLPQVGRRTAEFRRLVRLSRCAHGGGNVQPELDELVAQLYGISSAEHERLRRLLDARLGR